MTSDLSNIAAAEHVLQDRIRTLTAPVVVDLSLKDVECIMHLVTSPGFETFLLHMFEKCSSDMRNSVRNAARGQDRMLEAFAANEKMYMLEGFRREMLTHAERAAKNFGPAIG